MTSRAPRAADAAIALGCWALAIATLLMLPLAAAADAELAAVLAPVGSAAWSLTAAVITLQAVALLWARSAPRLVALVVTVLAVALALATPGAIFDLSSVAVVVAVFLAVARRPAELRGWLPLIGLLTAAGVLVNEVGSAHVNLPGLLAEAIPQALVVVGGTGTARAGARGPTGGARRPPQRGERARP